MGSRFPESGMAAVLDLSKWTGPVNQYLSDVDRMNRADAASEKAANKASKARSDYDATLKKAADTAQKASKSFGDLKNKSLADLIPASLTERLSGFTDGIGNLVSRFNFLPPSISSAVSGLGSFEGVLGGTLGKLNLTVVAVTALTAAFIGLGMRGASMRGVVEAFDITSQRAGVLSQVLLQDLRDASRGTVSDMQLITQANVALAGAEGEVAEALGQGGLAGMMEIARAQARATGQDVDFLFQSLVSGVKRSSPMLIDNTGLVLKVGEANEKYAASIGKTVDQLTASDKQIALLNATLEAGKTAVDTYGQGTLTAAERLAQMGTLITNTLDKLALAVQPAFEMLLAVAGTILEVIVWPIQNIVIPIFYELVNTIFGPLLNAFERFRSALGDMLAPVLQTVHRWVVLVVSIIRVFGMALNWLVNAASSVLSPFKDILVGTIIEPIATLLDPAAFAQRAGAIFGAFATGIMWAANTLIFPAVIFIAQTIADFLMGFSPPKKGPLSQIDQGGANVMQAWLQGFMGVSLMPVTAMAANINAELGAIGNLGRDGVSYWLARLDRQLQPFIDNLEIAEARMNAIVEPLKTAQEILSKRVTQNVKKFFAGDLSAEEMRALDAQNQAIADQVNLYSDMTDEAKLQLSMMEAQQAVARTLLGIRQAQLGTAETTTEATTGGTGAAETGGKKKATGGSTEEETAISGGGSFPAIDSDPIGDFLGVTDEEVQQLWGDMATGFAGAMQDFPGFNEQWALANQNVGQLSEALSGIKDSKPFQFLTDAVDTVFGTGPDSIVGRVTTFKDEHLQPLWDSMFGEEGFINSLSLQGILDSFTSIFGDEAAGLRSILNWFKIKLEVNFSPGGILESIFGGFSLQGLIDTFTNAFENPEQSITTILNGFKDLAASIFGNVKGSALYDLLSSIGGMLSELLLSPVIAVANAVIGAVIEGINKVIEFVNEFIKVMDQVLSIAKIDISEIKPLEPGNYQITMPEFKTGGAFGPGLAKVHGGEVLVSSGAQQTAVFPARWVTAMETLARNTSRQSTPAPASSRPYFIVDRGGGNTMTVHQLFTGQTDSRSVKRAWYELQALGAF